MKYTIIGGSGFIGTRLCELLEDCQIPFEIIDVKPSRRYPENTIVADIRDIDALRRSVTGDVIIHLAAVHRDDVRDSSLYTSTNVEGTKNICKVAEERGIGRIVFTSTVAVYGFAEPGTGEGGAINPFNEYGRTKYAAELALSGWLENDPESRHLVIVRPTVVFGEGNRGNVYNLLRQIASGRFVMIGSGRNKKSMAYVGNVAAFLLYVSSNVETGVFNYVDKPDFDMNTLVAKVRKELSGNQSVGLRIPFFAGLLMGYIADGISMITGKRLPISSIRVKKFCATTEFSSAAHETGFKAPFHLVDGLEKTLRAEFVEPDPDREIFNTE